MCIAIWCSNDVGQLVGFVVCWDKIADVGESVLFEETDGVVLEARMELIEFSVGSCVGAEFVAAIIGLGSNRAHGQEGNEGKEELFHVVLN